MVGSVHYGGRFFKVFCEDKLVSQYVSVLRTERDIRIYLEEAIQLKIFHHPSEVFQSGFQKFPFYQWDFGGKFDGNAFYITQL